MIPPTRAGEDELASSPARCATRPQRLADLRAQRAANLAGSQAAGRAGRAPRRRRREDGHARRSSTTPSAVPAPRWRSSADGDLRGPRRAGGVGRAPARRRACGCARDLEGDSLVLDFDGTDDQIEGNLNCPLAVTKSAAFFAVRVLTDPDGPPSAGAFRPIEVRAPEGCAAERPPARRRRRRERRDLQPGRRPGAGRAGRRGAGAGPGPGDDEQPDARRRGLDLLRDDPAAARAPARRPTGPAPSTWRCRTRSTPRSRRSRPSTRCGCASSALRRGSGGAGRHRGGDGIVRELEALEPMRFTPDHRAPPPPTARPRAAAPTARPGGTC